MLDRRSHLVLSTDSSVAQSVVAAQCLEAQNNARATLTWSVHVVLRRAVHPRTPHASGAPRKSLNLTAQVSGLKVGMAAEDSIDRFQFPAPPAKPNAGVGARRPRRASRQRAATLPVTSSAAVRALPELHAGG